MAKSVPSSRFYGNKLSLNRRNSTRSFKKSVASKPMAKIVKAVQLATKKPSFTKTKTSKKEKVIQSPGNGTLSHSYASYGPRKAKNFFGRMVRQLSGPQTTQRQTVSLITGTSGEQHRERDLINGTTGGLFAMLTEATKTPGIDQQGALSNTIPADLNMAGVKLMYEQTRRDLMITNSADFPTMVTIYTVVARKDEIRGDLIDPIAMWDYGILQQAKLPQSASVTYPNGNPSEYPFSHPRQSRDFNKYWKIVKTTRLEMAAGRTHRHIDDIYCNRQINKEDLLRAYANSSSGIWAGITCCHIITAVGVPCVSEQNVPSLSIPRLIVREARRERFRSLLTIPKYYAQYNALPVLQTEVLQATEIDRAGA